MRLPLLCCGLIFATMAIPLQAAPPAAFSFQGRLTDADGSPLADSSWSVRFYIYSDSVASGPSDLLWDSGPTEISTTNGLFTVLLGISPMTALPDSLFADSAAWLAIAVGADPELSPRTRIASVPYALTAHSADRLTSDPFVDESGDTISGDLAVAGNFTAGTDFVEAPSTFRAHDNWNWNIGSGYGDLRLSDGVAGLSLGVSSAGSGSGTVRFWSSGGFVENLFFGSPTYGDIFEIHGTGQTVFRYRTDWIDSTLPGTRISLNPKNSQVSVVGADAMNKVDMIGSGSSGLVSVQNADGVASLTLDGGDALGGQATLYRDDGTFSVYVRGGSAAMNEGGSIDLWSNDSESLPTISLYGARAGDASVVLPANAINSTEMEDEPGIAAGIRTTELSLGTVMTDIVTVSITIPAHGYIVLDATAQLKTSGTTGINDAFVQIDETSGGNLIPAQYVQFGLGGYANDGENYFPLSTQRVYFRPVGTYTFRLEGLLASGGGGTATCQFARITAMYFPSSYGSVATSAATSSGFPDAVPIQALGVTRSGYAIESGYEVDLSVLEMRAREAKLAEIEAAQARIQAEMELVRARLRQTRTDAATQQ